MHPLHVLFGFFLRFLPSFTAPGYHVRKALSWQPLRRGFDGETWLITGASGGLGAELTRQAAARGARVLAVARSEHKLAALRDSADPHCEHIETRVADCSLIADMQALAGTLAGRQVDVLVHNVGVMRPSFRLNAENMEVAFATNVLAPYALTRALLDNGTLADDALVIAMSSGGMYNVAFENRGTRSHRERVQRCPAIRAAQARAIGHGGQLSG